MPPVLNPIPVPNQRQSKARGEAEEGRIPLLKLHQELQIAAS